MKVSVIQAGELSREQIMQWTKFQSGNPVLANPFFSPEFTIASNKVRGNAFIGILKHDGEIVGFFPFERQGRTSGRPIGGPISDYQGVIIARETPWEAVDLIRA